MVQIQCQFSEPVVVNKSGEIITFIYPTEKNQNFQWRQVDCTSTGTDSSVALIQNQQVTDSALLFEKIDRLPLGIDFLIVGTWAFFVIMFIKFIWRWFFGRL